jgi:hypothetical protein
MMKREHFALLVIVAAILTACGTAATEAPTLIPTKVFPTRVPVEPTQNTQNGANGEAQPTAVAVQPTTAPTIAPTIEPTVQPTTAPTATQIVIATATKAGLTGNVANGENLFKNGPGNAIPACATCHGLSPAEEPKIGPVMQNVQAHAAMHAQSQGQNVVTYLHTSIVNPNAFLVPNEGSKVYSAGGISLMYQNYAKDLTEEQIQDIIVYLLMLK